VQATAPNITNTIMPTTIKRLTKVTSDIGNLLIKIGGAGLRQYISTSCARRQMAFGVEVCVKLLGSGIMPKKSPQNHLEGHAFTLETCVTQKRDAHPRRELAVRG
jgi:hypothetical protein